MAVLAIDLQGGDLGPSHLLPASIDFFEQNPHHRAILFGQESLCRPHLTALPPNVSFRACDGELPAGLNPARLLRHDYGSSIESATQLLAQDEADALVSSEHTGVLMTLLHRHSLVHPALERPALVSWVPTVRQPVLMLDLGASFSASAEQLLGFAAAGLAIAGDRNSRKPRLALLNLGVEANKGPPALHLAAQQLAAWPDVDFCGFAEANAIFRGDFDLVITDGFTGNAVIKSAEGTVDLLLSALRARLGGDLLGRTMGWVLGRRLKPLLQQLDPRYSNGALLAGTGLTLVKSHGHADGLAFRAAIQRAVEATEGGWSQRVLRRLDPLLAD